MTEQAQSEYYQAIAREFLSRRGAPFFLSPRDLAVIAGWEKNGVPLPVVLEGIGRAFDGLRDRARGTKGLSLSFCETQVRRALGQHADRGAGRRRAAAPRAKKVARALGEVEAFLRNAAADDRELRSLFEKAAGLLSQPSPDEEALERIDSNVDEWLWARTSRAEREGQERRTAGELPEKGPGEVGAAARTRLVKSAREKHEIPYVSLFYY
jgi:hypothetical protein